MSKPKNTFLTRLECSKVIDWLKTNPSAQSEMKRVGRVSAIRDQIHVELTATQLFSLERELGLTRTYNNPPPAPEAAPESVPELVESVFSPEIRPEQTGDMTEIVRRMRRMETMLYRLMKALSIDPRATPGQSFDQQLTEARHYLDGNTASVPDFMSERHN